MKFLKYLFIIIFVLSLFGCASKNHYEAQIEYYRILSKQLENQQLDQKPLLDLTFDKDPDIGLYVKTITISNPTQNFQTPKFNIPQPAAPPGYLLARDIFQSPILTAVAGTLSYGLASKWTIDAVGDVAGNRIYDSYNTGSYNNSGGGDIPISTNGQSLIDRSYNEQNINRTKTTYNTDINNDESISESYNKSQSDNPIDNSDSYNKTNTDNPIDNSTQTVY
jgi:hypothetical protein